jgi:hypothetical protein
LYAGKELEHAKLIVPKKLTQLIIEAHHDKFFAGHPGVKRTHDLVKQNYFWPSMNQDIEKYVKQCESCAKFKAGRQPTAPLGELPETNAPFELVSIDICRPYPETKKYVRLYADRVRICFRSVPLPVTQKFRYNVYIW